MASPRFRRGLQVSSPLKLDGTQVQATAAEINQLHGATITAAQLTEAGAFFGATDITAAEAEELTDGSTTSKHEHALAHGANDVTATAAELNELASAGAVQADFVKLHALTSTAAQINSLARFPGLHAVAVLRVASNVADGETVTIGADVYEFDTGDGVASGNIAVDVSGGVTPAIATDALIAAINASGTEPVTAVDISDNEVLIYADTPGATTTALAETMAGANNAWDTGALRAGAAAGLKRVVAVARVPNAQEVALGNLHVALGFTPTAYNVEVRVTATGALTAWDGAVVPRAWGLTLDNSGSTDWAVTDTIYILAME